MTETPKRCRVFSDGARAACAACGDEWTAADRHVCPDLRQVAQPAALPLAPIGVTERAVLVAMLTRGAPLIDGPAGPFVRGWGGEVSRKIRDRLLALGFVRRAEAPRHVLILTEAGRNVALNACTPETRARLSA